MTNKNDELPYFHISPLNGLDQQLSEDCGYILCSMNNVPYEGKNVLVLHFMDVEYEKHPDRFTKSDAHTIKSFVDRSLKEGIREFFICCDYGQSRSPAIAAALSEAFGLNGNYVWENKDDYEPNLLVYNIMKEELKKRNE